MGDWFGAHCRAVDRELLKVYADRLSRRGIGYWQAHSHAENIVCESIVRAKRTGRYDAGPLGLKMLRVTDGPLAERHARIRETHNVTDDDIRWWWDLDEVQRIATRMEDEQHHARLLLRSLGAGHDPETALCECRRTSPHFDFGDGFSQCGLIGDELIPIELLHRIERALDAGLLPPEAPDDYPHYNAIVLERIRQGLV